MPNLSLNADDFVSRNLKRKSAVPSDGPATDEPPSAPPSVADSDDLCMRERHRAAGRVASLAVVPTLLSPLPESPVSDVDRATKRARLQHEFGRLAHEPDYCPPSPSPTRSRHPAFGKRRSYSLPNLRIRPHVPSPSAPPSPSPSPPVTFTRSNSAPPGFPSPGKRYVPPPHVPNVHPLINRETLKELDLEAILRNPQLRHDLLLDAGLQFQPTVSRRKRDLTTKYWIAIQRELETGCTCTAFDTHGDALLCECRGPLPPSSERAPRLNMPSRIQPLVTELLEVLLSVIAPQPSSPSQSPSIPPAASHSAPHTSASQPQKLPTTVFQHPSHSSQEAQLRAALDPRLIAQELEHGVFDPSGLFTLLGTVLKCHCAPMRDRMVDSMVSAAQNCTENMGEATRAIRMCFDILELMKLDIANHQLLALRPYLLASASEFELRTFQERYGNGEISLTETRSWLRSAYAKLGSPPSQPPTQSQPDLQTLSSTQPHTQAQPPQQVSALTSKALSGESRSRHVQVATINALIDSVFSPRKDGATTHTIYPETLYMDHTRLAALTSEMHDLLVLYSLLMLARQLACSPSTSPTPRRLDIAEMKDLKREIIELAGPERLGRFIAGNHSRDHNKEKKTEGRRGRGRERSNRGTEGSDSVSDAKAPVWKQRLADVLLQLAARATCPPRSAERGRDAGTPVPASSSPSELSTSPPPPLSHRQLPEKTTLDLLDGWAASNLTQDAALTQLLKARLQAATTEVVLGNTFTNDPAAPAQFFGHPFDAQGQGLTLSADVIKQPETQTLWASQGLDVLAEEIVVLGVKIHNLTSCHWKIYGSLYEANGFL